MYGCYSNDWHRLERDSSREGEWLSDHLKMLHLHMDSI